MASEAAALPPSVPTLAPYPQINKENCKRIAVVALVVAALVTAAVFSGDAALAMCKAADMQSFGLIMGGGALWGVTTGLGISTVTALVQAKRNYIWKQNQNFTSDTCDYLITVGHISLISTVAATAFGSFIALHPADPTLAFWVSFMI